eukprot:15454670-Alexandrium_andersonii.AAC.1
MAGRSGGRVGLLLGLESILPPRPFRLKASKGDWCSSFAAFRTPVWAPAGRHGTHSGGTGNPYLSGSGGGIL